MAGNGGDARRGAVTDDERAKAAEWNEERELERRRQLVDELERG